MAVFKQTTKTKISLCSFCTKTYNFDGKTWGIVIYLAQNTAGDTRRNLMKKLIFILLAAFFTLTAFAAERFVIPLDSENNLTGGAKVFSIDGVDIEADMTRPAAPFVPVTFSFKFFEDGQAAEVENVRIQFNMKMDMGEHLYRPEKTEDGYSVNATLPKCMMGGDTWFAKLSFTHKGQVLSKVFFFKVER